MNDVQHYYKLLETQFNQELINLGINPFENNINLQTGSVNLIN